MDLFLNDWGYVCIILSRCPMLSPCSMQLRHVHAWHGYVDLWPPCERWLKGATGDAMDLVNFVSGFHHCTMLKLCVLPCYTSNMLPSWSILCFDKMAMVCDGATAVQWRIYKAAFKAICVAALAIAPSMMPGPLGPLVGGGSKKASCGTVSVKPRPRPCERPSR